MQNTSWTNYIMCILMNLRVNIFNFGKVVLGAFKDFSFIYTL